MRSRTRSNTNGKFDVNASQSADQLPPYPQEAVLIQALGELAGDSLLCMSAGLAQFAAAAAQALPHASVTCSYLDLYRATLAKEHWGTRHSNLHIECAADLPQGEHDVVALPFSSGGEAELTRELIQAAHLRLKMGGRLYASTENRKDSWLGEVLAKLFRKIERRESQNGTLYVAAKTEPLKKVKDYTCEFAFRDRGRLIRAVSRPGVFSHRRIDPGARHLIDTMEITPGARVVDIGCGSGTVALAAAFRDENVTVHAIDSNARAVESVQLGAHQNSLTNVTTELNADGQFAGPGSYDLALANPPYYAGFRIAEHFVTSARTALRAGGVILVVTKRTDWYEEHLPIWFNQVAITERKGYYLVRGVRPNG